MRLVIAEKKLTAEAIAKAIFDKYEYRDKVFKGTGNNSDVVIAHCSGHLISLKDPHEYDEKLKKWDIETLPFMFRKPKFNVVPHHKDMFNNMKNLIQKASLIYHAGDPDDEGQLIVDEVLNYAKYTGKPGYELVAGEVLGSVEAHMLQEVGETALVVVLKNRSDLLGDEEVCLTLGGLVVADVVVEAVGEHTVAHLRVGRQFVGLLGEAGEGHHGHRESGEQRFEVEFHWICKLNG